MSFIEGDYFRVRLGVEKFVDGEVLPVAIFSAINVDRRKIELGCLQLLILFVLVHELHLGEDGAGDRDQEGRHLESLCRVR